MIKDSWPIKPKDGVYALCEWPSVPTGRKVYAAAAAGMKHVTMELGGKSPLIIFDDASLEDAVGAAMLANFYSAGQVCSNGTRVFVQKGIKARFLARLAERAATIVMGDPLDEATQMGPLVSELQRDKVLAYVQHELIAHEMNAFDAALALDLLGGRAAPECE